MHLPDLEVILWIFFSASESVKMVFLSVVASEMAADISYTGLRNYDEQTENSQLRY